MRKSTKKPILLQIATPDLLDRLCEPVDAADVQRLKSGLYAAAMPARLREALDAAATGADFEELNALLRAFGSQSKVHFGAQSVAEVSTASLALELRRRKIDHIDWQENIHRGILWGLRNISETP